MLTERELALMDKMVYSKNDFFTQGRNVMSDNNDFANKLKELRTARGLTQRQLADLMFVSNGTIANWETGNRLPDISMLARLSQCLNVDTYTLVNELHPETKDAPRVIIVEDVPLVLRGSVHMLEQEIPQAEIVGFSSAAEALSYARLNPVSIAFLDIELPGENGMDLGKALKKLNPRINIIYLTSHNEYIEEAVHDHCSGYILKPLKPERIRHEIEGLRYPVGGLGI